jgi:uncharacterized membrane protein YfcA
MQYVTYWLWPNPGNAHYDNPKVIALLLVCAGFVLASFVLRYWRKKVRNPITKKLSRSWASATLWFGIVGLIMLVSRVEQVSFLSMRILWVVWLASILVYMFFQIRLFRARHYETLPREHRDDPRDRYLPKKKH